MRRSLKPDQNKKYNEALKFLEWFSNRRLVYTRVFGVPAHVFANHMDEIRNARTKK